MWMCRSSVGLLLPIIQAARANCSCELLNVTEYDAVDAAHVARRFSYAMTHCSWFTCSVEIRALI